MGCDFSWRRRITRFAALAVVLAMAASTFTGGCGDEESTDTGTGTTGVAPIPAPTPSRPPTLPKEGGQTLTVVVPAAPTGGS